jgi:uncharacterized membrane protein
MLEQLRLKEKVSNSRRNTGKFNLILGNDGLTLTLIVALSIVLRFYNISSESYWVDEGFSIEKAAKSFLKFIHDLPSDTRSDNNPPAYFIFLHFWSLLFGLGETATIYLSALLGIISVILIYYLGKRLHSERVGFISAFLLSISVFHVQYSQEARSYSMLVMMSLVSYLFFTKALERGGKVLAYFFSSVVLIYTHVFGILILLSQAIYLFIERPGHFSRIFKVQLLTALTFLPWVACLYWNVDFGINQGFVESYSRPPTLVNLHRIMIPIGFFSNVLWHQWIGIPCLITFCYLFLIALGRPTLIQALWFIIPFVIIMFLASVPKSILYSSRYFLMTLPAFYLLCSIGFVKSNRYVQVVSMCMILAFTGYNFYLFYTTIKKPQWRAVVASISSGYQQNDSVVIVGDAIQVVDYYSDKKLDRLRVSVWSKMLESQRDSIREEIKSHDRLWVIVEDRNIPKLQSLGIEDLFSGFRKVESQSFQGLQLSLLVLNEGVGKGVDQGQ